MPKEKRVFGYFALPVLVGDEIVAALDLKTDREQRQAAGAEMDLGRQAARPRAHKRRIEEALHRFERFQLADVANGGTPNGEPVMPNADLTAGC